MASLAINKVHEGDCLTVMEKIPDRTIDMILCDLPYGTTHAKWDSVIPLDLLWAQYSRIIKDGGAIVLTAAQPFTSQLVMSNSKWFKYELIWDKCNTTGHLNAKKMPMRQHESVLVFSNKTPTYNPQMEVIDESDSRYRKNGRPSTKSKGSDSVYNKFTPLHQEESGLRYPKTIIKINNPNRGKVHPTQKPVPLFEYLIRTYTNEGEVILDNCIGSGTTAVAAINTNRNFIGIEREPEYVEIARQRIVKEDA